MQLTQEQKRIRIAEACGITDAWDVSRNPVGATACGWLGWSGDKQVAVPDYFNDLNAMHEAENWLRTQGVVWVDYENRITKCATASERAEAFGRTLNLW